MPVPADVRSALAAVLCPRWPRGSDGIDLGDGGERLMPGGYAIFRAEFPAALDGLRALRAASASPGWPYICSDLERGAGQQIDGLTRLPPALALGAAGDEALAYEAGRNTGLEALAAGIAFVFAPVLDVANEPRNPIVATRAFAADPHVVAKLAAAWIRGCQSTGAIATGKHYPGHGATTEDSHLELPVLRRTASELAALEEIPFAAAIAAGVGAFMVGHLYVPALDAEAGTPASLSCSVIDGRLRKVLGFDGVVFTDALDMGAIARPTDGDPAAEPAVRCLIAGSDVALLPDDPTRAARNVLAALERGVLSRTRLFDAARRVRDAVARVPVRQLPALAREPAGADLALRIARASVTLCAGAPAPNLRDQEIECASIDDGDGVRALPVLLERLRSCGIRARQVERPSGAAACLIVVFSDVRAWKGRVLLDAPRARQLDGWLDACSTAPWLASIGCPQAVLPYAGRARTVFVYDADDASLTALAEALAGQFVPRGARVFATT